MIISIIGNWACRWPDIKRWSLQCFKYQVVRHKWVALSISIIYARSSYSSAMLLMLLHEQAVIQYNKDRQYSFAHVSLQQSALIIYRDSI